MAALKAALIGLLAASSVVGKDIPAMKGFPLDIISDKFETCPQYSELNNTISDLTSWNPPDEEVLYITGTLVLTVPLEDTKDYKYEMILKKCLGQDWSRCEKYIDIEIDRMCDSLPREEHPWSSVVKKLENFDPHCPLRPGRYNFEDAPVDTSELSKVEIAEGYWQIQLLTAFKGEPIFCVIGNAKIKRKPLRPKF